MNSLLFELELQNRSMRVCAEGDLGMGGGKNQPRSLSALMKLAFLSKTDRNNASVTRM